MAKGSKTRYQADPAMAELQTLNHKALVRAVVSMGMPFEEVIESSDLTKGNWFLRNWYTSHRDPKLIDDFDRWRHKIFKQNGKTRKKDPYMFDPRLNYGFIAEVSSKGEVTKERRIRGHSKKLKIKKREKDKAFKIFKGTKKALTFDCAARNIDINETIKIVKEQFPEAIDKSIKIWYSRASKEAKRIRTMMPETSKQWEQPLELPKKKLRLKLKNKETRKLKLKLKK